MLQGLAADSRPDGFQQLHIRCAAAQHFSQLYAFLAGQTGKLIGDLPVDKGRVAAWFAGISIPLMILTALFMLL